MSVKSFISVAAIAAVTGLGASIASAITIPTVPVGNPGNAPDPFTGNLYGSVAYTYNIGTTEVTNAQYASFLNAVAFDDPNSLYSQNMAGSFGGITRTGNIGAFVYNTVPGRANHPVNFVSFWNATRFANWLHNGQPTGFQDNTTTENGAYTLTADGITANTVTRNANWQWAVTSEDEWYKAAYHQPASQGGDSDNYWMYPTQSNTMTTAQANVFGNNINNTTPVGSYAANFYVTFDMGGNVFEWNEAIIGGSDRGIRGGAFAAAGILVRADNRNANNPPVPTDSRIGFRVSQVPGPSSFALLTIGGLMAARRRRA